MEELKSLLEKYLNKELLSMVISGSRGAQISGGVVPGNEGFS